MPEQALLNPSEGHSLLGLSMSSWLQCFFSFLIAALRYLVVRKRQVVSSGWGPYQICLAKAVLSQREKHSLGLLLSLQTAKVTETT